jgi:hypothetical protein
METKPFWLEKWMKVFDNPFISPKFAKRNQEFIQETLEKQHEKIVQAVSNLTMPSINSPTEREYDRAIADVLKILKKNKP